MLNRIMITELAFPAILVGGGLAFEQLVAPSRVLFGNISDSWPIKGRKRTPYIYLGSAGFCFLAVLSIPIIFLTERSLTQGSLTAIAISVIGLCSLFALYGLAISMATTPYLALIIDLTNEKERPKAVGVIWCMLTIGIVIGAIAISITTKNLDGITDPSLLQPTLQQFMIKVSGIIFAIAILSCWGIEKSEHKAYKTLTSKSKEIGLRDAWSLITSSKQIFIFFSFLIFYTLGLFLQDPILESFGAEVFSLPISKTTLLNAYWGIGTLVGLLIGGLLIIPRIGKYSAAKLGCWMIAYSLGLIILSGVIGNSNLLFGILFIFGIAAGIATNSALSLMLDLTLPQVAGTFVGVWGLAQALSRAMGKLMGGGLLDLGRIFSGQDNPLSAFAFVFTVEIIIVLSSILILNYVNVNKFKKETSAKMETLIMSELE
ncbi:MULTISPECIES: MFS transporter [unclassified Prochlorococcus]|nr:MULTISPECIES: MFS transporter [unclassified Prochlorococcus]